MSRSGSRGRPQGLRHGQPQQRRPAPSPSGEHSAQFAQALALHQGGRLVEAESMYRQILAGDPTNFDARHLLGVVHHQRGDHVAALSHIDAALQARADIAAAHNNRGSTLAALGCLEEAAGSYARAVALAPDFVDALVNRANTLGKLARFEAALGCYDQVIARSPHHAAAWAGRGDVLQGLQRHEEAVANYDRALALNPHSSETCNNRGIALARLGLALEAVASYERAVELQPQNARAFGNCGLVLAGLGRFEEALSSYDRAVALGTTDAGILANRGRALVALGRLEHAIASFERAIEIKPDNAEAFNDRAVALSKLGRYEEAIESCDRSIQLKPDNPEAFNNRGNVLGALKRFEPALSSFESAIGLRPDYADAFSNRATVLRELRRFDEAIDSCERAVALGPDCAEYHNNLAVVLADLRRLDAALASYRQAIALKPDYAEAHSNLGFALRDLNRFDDALASFARAMALRPDLDYLQGTHVHAKMHVCDWSDFDRDCTQLRVAIAAGRPAALPFHALAIPARPEQQFRCAEIYARDKCPTANTPLWRGERYAHSRIRVAYLSADLRDHPIATLAAGLFARHDRSRFETVAISFKSDTRNQVQERLITRFGRFIDARAMSDRDVARLVRDMEVDIAIDLNGFTEGSRPNIFAQRPAPVQVNYLGFAGTLGQGAWDYIIADRFVIPDQGCGHFAEKVVYVPDCFMVTDADRGISPRNPSRAEAGLPDEAFVFCCFNNSFKITPDVFDVWARLLAEIDGSVLWLSAANSAAVGNLRREAARRGVAPDRLIFAQRLPASEDHLARLRLADLFLDTLHYNAHATAADALWAGVPVLTCPGGTFASRVAGSLLHAAGLPELVAGSLADYEMLALRLARDPAVLSSLRRKLADNRDVCPLFDTDRFTRRLEAAYETMWQRTQRGEPPQCFAVADV